MRDDGNRKPEELVCIGGPLNGNRIPRGRSMFTIPLFPRPLPAVSLDATILDEVAVYRLQSLHAGGEVAFYLLDDVSPLDALRLLVEHYQPPRVNDE